ncbi:MAG TPA: energy transducer TonB [Terriglobales bacterium]|nr:energy transducer TonB [Terriglobales bacterium]
MTRPLIAFTLGCLFLCPCVVAQQKKTKPPEAPAPPCLGENETVYRPDTNGVVPPEPLEMNEKRAPRLAGGYARLELLVGSQGKVCDVRILDASNPASGQKMADYIRKYWTFKPGTFHDKPVPVKLTASFDESR